MESTQPPESPSTTATWPLALSDSSLPAASHLSLIGREEELTRLRVRLRGKGNAALTALNGLPGVGKTALAIALAHDPELRAHFTDGILWAGLGPTPNLQSHLSRWGSVLGLSQSEMSTFKTSVDWGVSLRRAIGTRTMLLVIDDAWSVEETLALKIGGPNCAHLVTTRFPTIAAEITAEGAATIEELNSDEGIALLRLLAPAVVENELPRAHELVKAVGGLPLALTLIGNYLRLQSAAGQDWRVTAALEKLSEASTRLNISELHSAIENYPGLSGDTPISLRTVIAVTEQQLDPQLSQALYALSVFFPRPNTFTEEAALAVTANTIDILDQLTDTGLLEISGADRYSLHQTIADYARLQLADDNTLQRLTNQRLIDYFTTFTGAHRKDYEILEAESTNILAALEAAAEQSYDTELTHIAVAFAPFLLARSLYQTAEVHLQRAYHAALTQQNTYGLASALLYLGEMARKRGNYDQAEHYLQEGLRYARGMNSHQRICEILAQLGSIKWRSGDYKQAEHYLQEGLVLARELEDPERISQMLDALGSVSLRQGHYARSREYLLEGVRLARQIGERELTCAILINLGVVANEQGDITQAETHLEEGLALARQLGHSEWISLLLNNLGDLACGKDDYSKAERYFQEGLELARRIGQDEWSSLLLINLGIVARKQLQYHLAEQYLNESLKLARQIGVPQMILHSLNEYGNLYLALDQPMEAETSFQEMLATVPEGNQDLLGLARYGLARALTIQGKNEEARSVGELSLQVLEAIGHYSTGEVRAWLALLPSHPQGEE